MLVFFHWLPFICVMLTAINSPVYVTVYDFKTIEIDRKIQFEHDSWKLSRHKVLMNAIKKLLDKMALLSLRHPEVKRMHVMSFNMRNNCGIHCSAVQFTEKKTHTRWSLTSDCLSGIHFHIHRCTWTWTRSACLIESTRATIFTLTSNKQCYEIRSKKIKKNWCTSSS